MALCARTWFIEALQCLRLVTLWQQDGIWEGRNTKDLGDAMMCDENGAMGEERNHQFLSEEMTNWNKLCKTVKEASILIVEDVKFEIDNVMEKEK